MEDIEMSANTSSFSASDVYYMLFRHKLKIVVFLLLGLAAAVVLFLGAPVGYKSDAKLLVRYVTETTLIGPEATGGRVVSPDDRGGNVINTEMLILQSQEIAEKVVADIGLERLGKRDHELSVPRKVARALLKRAGLTGWSRVTEAAVKGDMRLAASAILQDLTISNPRRSNIIMLEYIGHSPLLAQMILDKLVDAYLKKHFEVHRASGAYEFLTQQLDQTRSRLSQTEGELLALQSRLGSATVAEAKTEVAQRKRQIQYEIWQAESQLAGTLARVEALKGRKGEMLASGTAMSEGGKRTAADVDPRLLALKKREMDLLAVFTENSLPVESVRSQIDRFLRNAATATSTNDQDGASFADDATWQERDAVDPLFDEESNAVALRARILSMQEHLALLKQDEERIGEVEGKTTELQRKKEIEEANYRYFSQSLEKARIDNALDTEKLAGIGVVQSATVSGVQWRPHLLRNMFMALAMGAFLGVGWAFFSETMADQSVRHPRHMEESLSVPLLLSIPRLRSGKGILPWRSDVPARLLPAHVDADSGAAAQAHAASRSWRLDLGLSPYYQALRDRVVALLKRPPKGPCLVGLTACKPRSGVTSTAAGLALALARSGDGRILFLDIADLDHRAEEAMLGNARGVRLADIATDQSGHTTILQPNLFVLSGAESVGETLRPAACPRLDDVVMKLRESAYDFVVVDMPPVSAISAGLRVAPLLDGVILVVESEKVHRDAARQAMSLLSEAKANVIGSILNKERRYVPERLSSGI